MMSGGGITFKKFNPTIRSKHCFLLLPVQGSERKGLVSVEVKKKKGQVIDIDRSSISSLGMSVADWSCCELIREWLAMALADSLIFLFVSSV